MQEVKTKAAKQHERDPEKKKLRHLKRELRKEWKNNKDSNCVDDIRKRFFKVTKLLNIIRKQNAEMKSASDFQKQTRSFRNNPQRFAKTLYDSKQSHEPNFDTEKAQNFFRETYSDNYRGMVYQTPLGALRPAEPNNPFKTDPPTKEEIISSLKRKRNGAAPGPNGIPYLIYKKIPFLQHHLCIILQEMWPNFDLPGSRHGITGLIYKNGSNDEVSNYRPVTMTNTDGKIFLSVLASRSLSYMKNNGYYDLSIQKGFICDMAGCAEHTTVLSELLKNAKQTNRQITVCWTDLENAFGSLRHDLIQFALDWYHFPEEFRQFVHAYYEGISIRVRTSKWTTEPIALLKGIFQGCPLSVQLFNIVWNIGLDMVKSSSTKGYILKEAGIEKKQMSYVDDYTAIASSPEDAQLILDALDNYLSWTECMRAKPLKCRALAFKVFRKGVRENFTPVSGTKYSAFNPKLSISGQSIPFLGDEPFKFLGRKISGKKDGHNRIEIKDSLIKNLDKTDKANITGPMKMWLYNNYVVAFITWPFTIYDLPISFGEELKAIGTRYLKKWLGVTKSITESALYRSKDHFGLGLTNLVTHLKKMQVCRMHILKYSQDDSSKRVYDYMRERDRPPLNGLGIPLKPRIWKPTNALEDAERNFYLDSIAAGQQCNVRVNKSSVKRDRHNTLKRIERDEEEVRLIRCYGYAVQGDWLSFDAVLKADLSWSSLMYSIPQELLKFLINSTHNVLPTPDNLKRWGKAVVDMKCHLCGFLNPTLKHILNGCSVALKQGRYTWRHDKILMRMVEELQTFLQGVNAKKVSYVDLKDTFITFVREGKQSCGRRAARKSGVLLRANDWTLIYDSPEDPLVFPGHIIQTSLRPDVVIYSNTTKQVFLLELTVPMEDNIVQRHIDKENKYAKLLDDLNINQWTGQIFGLEVGSRGYVAKSFCFALRKLGLGHEVVRRLRRAVSLMCMRCSYSIYLSRKTEIWRPWEHHQLTRARNGDCLKNTSVSKVAETEDFCGFTREQISEASKKNQGRLHVLSKNTRDSGTFEGFDAMEIRKYERINEEKIVLLKRDNTIFVPRVYDQVIPETSGLVSLESKIYVSKEDPQKTIRGVRSHSRNSTGASLLPKVSGLINHGNTCYMNSVMQCLNCVTPLVAYFLEDAYLVDVNSSSPYDGTIAWEVGAAFSAMVAGRKNPVSLLALKGKVGEFHHQFSGSEQNDSHEFLMYLLAWLHEDLRGGSLPAFLGDGLTSHHVAAAGLNNEPSIVTLLFQGMHKHVIFCGNCQHESVSFEPFTVLSLALPASGNSTLKRLLHNYYEDTFITYKCPQCNKEGESLRKTFIQKMPPVLVLHLNRFEYAISARKKQNFVDFPVEGLSLRAHILCDIPSATYSLCAVSNHFGTLSGGHYTSYCRPSYGNVWYNCDDRSVSRLRTPVKTSAAYLLFYNSLQNV